MAKENSVYWSERKRAYDATLSKDEKRLYAKLATYYDREAAKLDKEIAAYYAKYGESGVLSYRNLLETLSDADKQLLIQDIDAFVQQYPEYADLVPVRESIYKLNRLEGLRQSVAMQQLQMGAYEIAQAEAFFQKQALRYANGAAKFLGLGSSFYRIDSDMVKVAVGNNWCEGKDFSERIWDNRTKLTRTLQTEIVNGIIRGEDYKTLSRQLREKFTNVSQKNAERLVFTEDTYLSNEAAMQAFLNQPDISQYQFVCVGDERTCSICRGLNGQTFHIQDRTPGENFPPMHPWCRCFFDVVMGKALTSKGKSGIIKIGFESDEALECHYSKHAKMYGDITKEKYVELANEMANSPTSEDLERITRSDESVSAYRFSTNDFLVVTKEGFIRTFFKPDSGEEYWKYEHERN